MQNNYDVEYVKGLENENKNLEQQLKVVESDREETKEVFGILLAGCIKALEAKSIKECKEIIKESIHNGAEDFKNSIKEGK